jgi:hypothetical protein
LNINYKLSPKTTGMGDLSLFPEAFAQILVGGMMILHIHYDLWRSGATGAEELHLDEA